MNAIAAQGESMFPSSPDLMSIEDLQTALGIGRSLAYRIINRGEIKHLRIGRKIRIPKRYLIDFIIHSCDNGQAAKAICPVVNEGGCRE